MDVRGRGLYAAVETESTEKALKFSMDLLKNGIICRNSTKILRFIPPLCMNEKELEESLEIIRKTCSE